MTVLPEHQVPEHAVVRGAMRAALAATMLAISVSAAAAVEECYHPEELRADAEAKLAGFLKEAIFVCADIVDGSGIETWEAFRTDPAISAGLAHADEVRAPYYQRLYGGDDWKLRWQRTEFTVAGHAGDVMQAHLPDRAGCAGLWRELATFKRDGWPAYSAAVDRFFATMLPQVRLCVP